ncbi:MAG TPA: hypothetical protein VFR90_16870 [Methylibium sp.]|uniref:hypothetical protein n=1 Tax=Methylibium sp. TaxID=2067992 RepID=UPI002DBB2D6B|nr:hypothetical protein [Methylibium sp.]HEU4460795.1 hypothetical protein [Methylibium sp.]
MKLAAAALVTLGGLLLHFLGDVSHRVYLQTLRLDAGLFPQTVDALVINGYFTLMGRFSVGLDSLKTNLWFIVPAIVALWLYAFLVRELVEYLDRSLSKKEWRPLGNAALRRLVQAGMIILAVSAAIPLFLYAALALLKPPAALGITAGRDAALRDTAMFLGGCKQPSIAAGCVELRKGEECLARGFVVSSTTSHIAIFDVRQQRAVAFERAGTTLHGDARSDLPESPDARSEADARSTVCAGRGT